MMRRRRLRTLVVALGVAAVVGVIAVAAVNAYVMIDAPSATARVNRLSHAQAAIVLGAFVQGDGRMSAMLADRVHRAASLWRAGKVDRILVSGDHHTWAYDEPDVMRNALLAQGVPGRVIFTDYAGVDTWASMVRARRVFGVRSAIVVTQAFHMPRALFLAAAAGLRAHGLTADLHGYGTQGTLSGLREVLARVKAVGQAVTDSRVVGGPPLPITGSGPTSWGPPAPRASAQPAGT